MTNRRALLAAPALLALPARAQLERPARIIIGFPPGGSVDVVARLYAEALRGTYAPHVVVESRPGAGARLAMDAVRTAAPDGSTMLLTPAGGFILHPTLFPHSVKPEPELEVAPITTVCALPFALVVPPGHPARDIAGFIAWAKAQREPISCGLPSAGSISHFAAMQIGRTLGLNLNAVPYRGSAPALSELMGGHIPMVVIPLGGVPGLHREGQVRILATTAPGPLASLPDVPSLAAAGYPDLAIEEWFGLFLPARTAPDTQTALQAAMRSAAATPALREGLAKIEYTPITMDSAALLARIKRERAHWAQVIHDTGFKVEE